MLQQPAEADHLHRNVHVIGCAALVRELRAVLPAGVGVTATYLPAQLHNRPDRIVPAIETALARVHEAATILIGYGDCGTGGDLDRAIHGWIAGSGRTITRLPGDHCYSFFAGAAEFEALHDDELGTLFLTDYLARHFDLLIWQGLGLDDHPELLPMYFGNYTRLVHLSQTDDPDTLAELDALSRRAAEQLGLRHEHRPTGLRPLASVVEVALGTAVNQPSIPGGR